MRYVALALLAGTLAFTIYYSPERIVARARKNGYPA